MSLDSNIPQTALIQTVDIPSIARLYTTVLLPFNLINRPRPRICRGAIFNIDHEAGPFKDKEALGDYLRKCAEFTREQHGTPIRPDLDASASASLVFTHQDLQMRDIILGKDGKIWAIDWGQSGFYPEYFEFIGLTLESSHVPWPSKSWERYLPLIANPFFDRELWRYQWSIFLAYIRGPPERREYRARELAGYSFM